MPGALARLLLRRIVTRPCRLVPAVGGGPKCPPCGPGKVRSHCYIRAPPATLFPFLMDALEPSQPPCTRAGCRSASPTRTARATGAWVACAPLVPSATTASGTPTRRLSTAAVSTAAACPAAGVSARPTDCADYPPALPAYTVRLCPCSSLSPLPPPCCHRQNLPDQLRLQVGFVRRRALRRGQALRQPGRERRAAQIWRPPAPPGSHHVWPVRLQGLPGERATRPSASGRPAITTAR